MADLLAELGKTTWEQWTLVVVTLAAIAVVSAFTILGLFKSDARVERERRELAEIEQVARLREQGLFR